MAQTFLRIVVDGFQANEVDFAAALQRKLGADKAAFDDFISSLVLAEEGASDTFWSVTVVGHSDRHDAAGLTSEQRRAVEFKASKERAISAGEFVLARLGDALTADGFTPPATVDDPTNIGFCVVPAGAAELVNVLPASEAERLQNRRVKFLLIRFAPQVEALVFGEQNLDRNIA